MRNRPYALHVFALVFAVLTMPLGNRLAEGQEEFKTEIAPNVGPGGVSSLAFSRDGRMALSGGLPPKLWDEAQAGCCERLALAAPPSHFRRTSGRPCHGARR
jgi:hypothetical protein